MLFISRWPFLLFCLVVRITEVIILAYLLLLNSVCCMCSPGQQCETEVNECESDPCFNNGTCTDQLNSFNCNCPLGFSGVQCEMNINECDPDPCHNGATCIDLIDAFKCVCVSGYTGGSNSIFVYISSVSEIPFYFSGFWFKKYNELFKSFIKGMHHLQVRCVI